MMLLLAKYKLYFIIGGLLTAAVLGAGWYVKHLNSQLENARERAVKSEYAYEVTAESLRLYGEEIVKRNVEIEDLHSIFKGANYDADKAMEIFRGDRLQKLLNDNPAAIIKRANAATTRVFDDITEVSRGDLTRGGETELAAP